LVHNTNKKNEDPTLYRCIGGSGVSRFAISDGAGIVCDQKNHQNIMASGKHIIGGGCLEPAG